MSGLGLVVVEGSLTAGPAGIVVNCPNDVDEVGSTCVKIGSPGDAILTIGNALCYNGGVPSPVATANDFDDLEVVKLVTDIPAVVSLKPRCYGAPAMPV